MKSGKTRLLAVLVALVLIASFFVLPTASAVEGTEETTGTDIKTNTSSTSVSAEYAKYLESVSGYADAAEDIVIDPTAYVGAEDCEFGTVGEGENATAAGNVISVKSYDVLTDAITGKKTAADCLVWADNDSFKQQGTVTYEIDVPADAVYNFKMTYLPLAKTGADADETNDKSTANPVEIGLLIDGEYLYSGLDSLSFARKFVNKGATADKPSGETRTDSLKNQLTPEQIEYGEFTSEYAVDPVGVVADPYKILLTAGTHKITIKSVSEPFALASIAFTAPQKVDSYEEYIAKYGSKPAYTGKAVEIEGESAWIKSTNSLVPKTDNSSSDITPHDPVKTILNYIGNTNWQVPGETITWLVDVPADGLYTLGINYKQATIIDGFTYRSLSIDGTVPFEECKSIRFDYCTSWEFMKFGGKKPYQFYLTAGKHLLSLTVTLGETAEFYSRLSEIVDVIGDTYIDIVMITGDSPDPNRDYDLFKQIPNFQETLLKSYNDLKKLSADMNVMSGDRSNKYISALNNMARVINNMYKNQYTAQTYLSDFYSNYTTVCSWLYEMKTMPLNLDQMQLASGTGKFKDNSSGFWYSFGFGCKRFFASFSDEFSTIAGSAEVTDKGSVRIWVNWGRDQAQVLSNLIQDDFTYKTGISVQLEIVNASVIKGILAGNFPDLSLHMSRTEPVNLGMRGALYDLTNFSNDKDSKFSTVDDGSTYLLDYETVLKRFQESADMPYWYDDGKHKGLYSLPDTQSFFIMFYRTDVFDNLGIPDPTLANNGMGWTWDDFLDAATILERNNMKAYIPYTKIASTTTVNAGMGSLHLFATMLTQNNVELYDDAWTKTNLTSGEAISAFTQWTDFYTKYGIEKQIDFYNRFRVGSAPLGVSSYTTYTQLTQAAPEIQGRWKIAAIPGIMQEDGTINRSIAGSGTGCGVIAPSKSKEQAWQFLCWWTSEEVQLRYNNNVESILGAVSRTATANVDAFSSYSWDANDLEILLYQWDQVKELPELPGGYYVSRSVDQAYWEVLNNESNEKDAMLKWGEIADDEIDRKISEYRK